MPSILLVLAAQAVTAAAVPPAPATVAAPVAPTAMVEAGQDLNRVKCKYKDKMNTRIAKIKTCMTIAQWNAYYRNDVPQFKRDINSGFAASPSQ